MKIYPLFFRSLLRVILLFLILLGTFTFSIGQSKAAGIDLHTHLFMKEGLGIIFNGDFFSPVKAKNWKSRFSSQINAEAVLKSDLDLIVVALYAHPFLTLNLRDSIRSQIRQAKQFVDRHPDWVLARSPQEARLALEAKKHVLVLSLEGTAGIIETEEDIQEFVEKEGIRMVTFFHLTDDHLGGAALLKGYRSFASPFGFFSALLHWNFGGDGVLKNPNGITEDGRKLLKLLLKHHVWIDLAHAPDQSIGEILPLLRQPILVSHTALREFNLMERALSDGLIEAIQARDGIVGLMPSVEMLGEISTPDRCNSGTNQLAFQYGELTKKLGVNTVAIGSDFNGGIYHLPPGAPHCPDTLPPEGFWNLGLFPQLWESLKNRGQPTDEVSLRNTTQHFLDCWDQIFN